MTATVAVRLSPLSVSVTVTRTGFDESVEMMSSLMMRAFNGGRRATNREPECARPNTQTPKGDNLQGDLKGDFTYLLSSSLSCHRDHRSL